MVRGIIREIAFGVIPFSAIFEKQKFVGKL